MTDLKPCPLCGSTNVTCFAEYDGDNWENTPVYRAVVACLGCHEEGCDPDYERAKMMVVMGATLMAEVHELGKRYDNMAVVLSRLVNMLRVRREAKGTSAMPVCGGLWDDEIESMTAEGASLSEIAARIGCGVATVSRRRRQFGADGAAYKRKWTDREDAVLREAVKLAGSWAEVAESLPGRTEAACCARAKRHGLRLRHNPPHAWTADEDAFLREHWVSCDMETPEIARALGRTEHAVRTRASKLGIADSERRKWALAKSSARFWARGAA